MNMGAEFWMAHVEAARQEAIPASEYARRHGLAVKSLYYWRRKLQKSGKIDAPLSAGKLYAIHEARTIQATISLVKSMACKFHGNKASISSTVLAAGSARMTRRSQA